MTKEIFLSGMTADQLEMIRESLRDELWQLHPEPCPPHTHRETATHGMFLSPSVGLGVAGGKLGSERYDARMVVTAGVALRYDLTRYLFCGMEAKVVATTGVGLPLVGIRIGFRF